MNELSSIKKDLPHLIVLVVLVLILLVVLTKFQWIHCSLVPGWCNVYCNVIMRSHSKVALISGNEGIGNPTELYNIIQKERGYTYLEKLETGEISGGVLKRYDLLILEKMRNVTSREAKAIKEYVDRGGSVLWIGDAAAVQTPDQYDVLKAKSMNTTFYEKLYKELNKRNETINSQYAQDQIKTWQDTDDYKLLVKAGLQKEYNADETEKKLLSPTPSFESLSNVVSAKYVDTKKQQKPLQLQIIDHTHLMTKGLKPVFEMNTKEYVSIAEDASKVDKIALIQTQDGNEHPGIMESRYAGRVVFIAFPLEAANSSTLVGNIVEYLVPC